MKQIKKIALLAVALALMSPVISHAGPIPASALQFPDWYGYQTTSFIVSSNAATTETNFAQIAIPRSAFGGHGFATVTMYVSSPDAAAVAHIWKGYFGGVGNPVAGGTTLFTNSTSAELADILTHTIFVTTNTSSLYCDGYTLTNGPAGGYAGAVTKTFDTTTNFYLTITGNSAQATNIMRLDAVLVNVTGLP